MSEKIEQIVTQTGAIVAVAPFFTMEWWNENSAGIVAICAAVGAVVSVVSFVVGQLRKKTKPSTGG